MDGHAYRVLKVTAELHAFIHGVLISSISECLSNEVKS
jgi:hypothetical protein